MKLKILFHDHCFDGVASASLFARFYRRVDPSAEIVFTGKSHRRGGAFDAQDFDADDHAVVDFRYSADARLGWWFDHHASAFESPSDEAHFRTRPNDRFFFEPTARSCTGLVARSLERVHGFDTRRHHELVHWAEIIDGAQFGSADEATALDRPALQLAAFVEHNRDPVLAQRFVRALTQVGFAELCKEPWVEEVVAEVREQQRAGEALVREKITVEHGVALLDVTDAAQGYNKFTPYKLAPQANYVVAVMVGDGIAKLSVGLNPWRKVERAHHIARLCERYGGGGHAFVGGVTLSSATPDGIAEARRIAGDMVAFLAKEP